jgi:hypothetical protein
MNAVPVVHEEYVGVAPLGTLTFSSSLPAVIFSLYEISHGPPEFTVAIWDCVGAAGPSGAP